MERIDLKHIGKRVLVAKNGALVADIPWEQALELGRALIYLARKAEEIEKAEAIVQDQAIIFRSGGLPFGLSAHPKIIEEGEKEAAWGDIRRYLPGGIKSKERLYPPGVVQSPPSLKQ